MNLNSEITHLARALKAPRISAAAATLASRAREEGMRLWQRACRLEQQGDRRLDTYIEQTLLPAHNRGARRTPHRPYREAGHTLRKQMKTMPSRDPNDPGSRRLRYCRYADDCLQPR